MVELQSLQAEIQKKDKQREDLLLKLKVLHLDPIYTTLNSFDGTAAHILVNKASCTMVQSIE